MVNIWKYAKIREDRYVVYNDHLQKSETTDSKESAKRLKDELNKEMNYALLGKSVVEESQ